MRHLSFGCFENKVNTTLNRKHKLGYLTRVDLEKQINTICKHNPFGQDNQITTPWTRPTIGQSNSTSMEPISATLWGGGDCSNHSQWSRRWEQMLNPHIYLSPMFPHTNSRVYRVKTIKKFGGFHNAAPYDHFRNRHVGVMSNAVKELNLFVPTTYWC